MGLLDTIKSTIEQAKKGGRSVIDPATFEDDMALTISWQPLKRGGTNIRSHKLHTEGAHRLCFTPTIMARVFPAIFILVGLGVIAAGIVSLSSKDGIPIYFALPFGGIFAGVGFMVYRMMCTPRIFDFDRSLFWHGKQPPADVDHHEQACELSEIYALQLLSEYCTSSSSNGGSSSYLSYELNLVLKDERRINVVDHGNINTLREACQQLSERLQVPVWDAA